MTDAMAGNTPAAKVTKMDTVSGAVRDQFVVQKPGDSMHEQTIAIPMNMLQSSTGAGATVATPGVAPVKTEKITDVHSFSSAVSQDEWVTVATDAYMDVFRTNQTDAESLKKAMPNQLWSSRL